MKLFYRFFLVIVLLKGLRVLRLERFNIDILNSLVVYS